MVAVGPVVDRLQGHADFDLQAQLLVQFPVQGCLRSLAILQLSAGKFPQQGETAARITPGRQDPAMRMDQGADYVEWIAVSHGKALIGRFTRRGATTKLNPAFALAQFTRKDYLNYMNWGLVIVALALVLFFVLPKLRQVSLPEAVKLLREGAAFIDVRTAGEFASNSIPGSKNLPLNDLPRLIEQEDIGKDDPVLVFCMSGMRSGTAYNQLRRLGYTRVYNVGSFPRAQKVWMLSQAPDASENG